MRTLPLTGAVIERPTVTISQIGTVCFLGAGVAAMHDYLAQPVSRLPLSGQDDQPCRPAASCFGLSLRGVELMRQCGTADSIAHREPRRGAGLD
jgi:hypothetical protein